MVAFGKEEHRATISEGCVFGMPVRENRTLETVFAGMKRVCTWVCTSNVDVEEKPVRSGTCGRSQDQRRDSRCIRIDREQDVPERHLVPAIPYAPETPRGSTKAADKVAAGKAANFSQTPVSLEMSTFVIKELAKLLGRCKSTDRHRRG